MRPGVRRQNGTDEFRVDHGIGDRIVIGGETFTGGTTVATFVLSKKTATTERVTAQLRPVLGGVTDKDAKVGKPYHLVGVQTYPRVHAQASVRNSALGQVPATLIMMRITRWLLLLLLLFETRNGAGKPQLRWVSPSTTTLLPAH